MTGRRFQALIRKHVLGGFPSFDMCGGILFARPFEYVLRGYCFESSGYDAATFYVWVFVQPLFVPARGIVLDLGRRLGGIRGKGCESWTLTEDNEEQVMGDVCIHMKREGPVILDKFKTLQDFVKNAGARDTNPYSLYSPEMVAYAAILLDDRKTAEKMFDRAEARYAKSSDRRDWVVALMQRIRSVRDTFRHHPAEAKARLNAWREETAGKLKLTKFLAPVE